MRMNACKIVWGVPGFIKDIYGLPPGKVRLRFRNTSSAVAFVRDSFGIRKFIICADELGNWYVDPSLEQGRNFRPQLSSYGTQKN